MSLSCSLVTALAIAVSHDEPPPSAAELPDGFSARVVATEPRIQDPVAFSVDPFGRLLIAETERTNRGAMDNRSSPWHLDDDLQSRTVEDRIAYIRKWAHKYENGLERYTEAPDRVRRTVDSDGDGLYDSHTIFAGPFNAIEDGIGAGVMPVGDEVWYTNIPHLWRLRDDDGDGVAEVQEPIQSGFGVRFALYGHDMHGLVPGPDGRIYWSIGDRGYHLETPDGRILADPRSGAVFRCERDGSGLEVFATGLRNPQELAFNAVGDLFTGDNTSDAGDKARIVFVAERGDTGWTMDYQTLEGSNLRGPWEQERIWEIVTKENESFRPDWTLPPLAHVGAGPSGLVYEPGLGLPAEYEDHFFMCDFTGSAPKSRIWTFRPVPSGAGYRIENPRIFLSGILNTDVDFDWDGRMLVSEWGRGWGSTRKGRMHAVEHEVSANDPRIVEAAALARDGMASLDVFTLADLLAHPARRLRLLAQYELAEREAVDELVGVARYAGRQPARLHAIWALGEIARKAAARNRRTASAQDPLLDLLHDPDAEVRAQAAKVLGDPPHPRAAGKLIDALADDSSRVRYHAAMSLGRIGDVEAAPYLVAMLAENDDQDRFLRHAGTVALAELGDDATLEEMMSSPSTALRRAALLAMRHDADPRIGRLLFDPDPRLRTEAARAVHDLPIPEAMPALASLADEYAGSDESSGRELQVRREIFQIDRNEGAGDLLSIPEFDSPAEDLEVTSAFEGRSNEGENFLTRLTARIAVPQTGPYRFSIASDDGSVLRFSPTGAAEDLVPIAAVERWVDPEDWNRQPGQTSDPIELNAGQTILLEARHAQGGGATHLAVAWRLPDGTFEGPIGGAVDLLPTETPLLRRVVDANLRGGSAADLERLAALAGNHRLPGVVRDEAMLAIATFEDPGPRDRVLGWWRPVDASRRDHDALRPVYARALPVLAEDPRSSVRASARAAASRLGVALDPSMLRATVLDPDADPADRVACLRQLARMEDESVPAALDATLASDSALLRASARDVLASQDVAAGVDAYLSVLERDFAGGEGEVIERQGALLGLASTRDPRALEHLRDEVRRSFTDEPAPNPWMVELIEIASASDDPQLSRFASEWLAESVDDPARWSVALLGGDADAGRKVAHYHPSAACLRCHVIEGVGGDAGPSLAGLAERGDPATILESLVDPQAVVVDGYGESSAMPNMRSLLTPREVRDLVAYLSQLSEESATGH